MRGSMSISLLMVWSVVPTVAFGGMPPPMFMPPGQQHRTCCGISTFQSSSILPKAMTTHSKTRTSSSSALRSVTHRNGEQQTCPEVPSILPAKTPLSLCCTKKKKKKNNHNHDKEFSVLSWNVLLPNNPCGENWWTHKMYAPWVPMEKREWSHRQALMRARLVTADADVICIQEADGDTFDEDFGFLDTEGGGYSHCLHNKFRFRCATFYKDTKFVLDQVAQKDRALVVSLRSVTDDDNDDDKLLHVVNCHLSGGAAPERRLRQVHEALEQLRKWKTKARQTFEKQQNAHRPSPKGIAQAKHALDLHTRQAGTVVCGDFNSDGNTGVRRLLVHGRVEREWREPQYPEVPLTSKDKLSEQRFLDAAELAYRSNVCDGDYGDETAGTTDGGRPATYVVPNLTKLLLLPDDDDDSAAVPRTQFGPQVARGLADTLQLVDFCEEEMERAFDTIDLDGNDSIDQDEVRSLLESAYVATYGKQIEQERNKFFKGFQKKKKKQASDHDDATTTSLSRTQIKDRLVGLQQELSSATSTKNDFSDRVARGLADTLGLANFCDTELDNAFDSIDLDGNDVIDEDELRTLLETVYVSTYGRQIEKEKRQFFDGFADTDDGDSSTTDDGMSRQQLTDRLTALQQELEGGREGSFVTEVRTEADAQRMIGRFSPVLKEALDKVFDDHATTSSDDILTQEDVDRFLITTNGRLGRGGTSRLTAALFQRKGDAGRGLTRQDWYGVFARELGEGKWWNVVYDLESCGANLRGGSSSSSSSSDENTNQHYQGWLDYLYFDAERLTCTGVQEALDASETSQLHDDGDALPNAWHPSDHLPVAATFRWS